MNTRQLRTIFVLVKEISIHLPRMYKIIMCPLLYLLPEKTFLVTADISPPPHTHTHLTVLTLKRAGWKQSITSCPLSMATIGLLWSLHPSSFCCRLSLVKLNRKKIFVLRKSAPPPPHPTLKNLTQFSLIFSVLKCFIF